jgi:hypothetical protein
MASKKEKIYLSTIPEPPEDSRTVVEWIGKGTVGLFSKDDVPDLCCGKCRAVIIRGMPRKKLKGAVLKCKNCGAFNDTRTDIN